MDQKPTPNNPDEEESLEAPASDVAQQASASSADGQPAAQNERPVSRFKRGGFGALLSHVNIYLLSFIFLLVLAGSGGGIYYLNTKKETVRSGDIKTQGLSTESLKQLANSDVSVGDSKQVLTVQSNAIFDGSVLLRGDVEVAGKLVVGDQLSLTGINVGGQSVLQDVSISNDLSVAHNLAVQGQTTLQGSLSVNGSTTFNGGLSVSRITTGSLQLSSNLTLTHHIVAGGATPSRSSGSALGGGGTTSVSGSDTSGSIKINTGSSPGAGCFITVNFANSYSSTPHVVVTPIGSAAGSLGYYVNRTSSSFSVCTTTAAPSSSSFGFDYIVLG